MGKTHTNIIAFVARCSGAATVAYEVALLLGLPTPLWAAMSALIVSQERLHETRSYLMGRVLGTVVGSIVCIMVSEAASHVGVGSTMQMAIAVAICALIAQKFPNLRVAMWTCPIILLTAQSSVPIVTTACHRGGEVILGAVIGWIFHCAAEILEAGLTGVAGGLPVRGAGQRR
jgi:uncharacterized membrane protein YccC